MASRPLTRSRARMRTTDDPPEAAKDAATQIRRIDDVLEKLNLIHDKLSDKLDYMVDILTEKTEAECERLHRQMQDLGRGGYRKRKFTRRK